MKDILARASALVAIAATALLAAACGGGGEIALLAGIIGSGGTGIGVATGFGSVIVDGVRRDDASARYSSDEDQAELAPVGSTAATIGQTLEFDDDANGAMTAVRISPMLVGLVSAISADGFSLLGTRVTVSADASRGPVTALAGYASASAIQPGDRVAVYGMLGGGGVSTPIVQATLIVRKTSGSGERLSGVVAQVDAVARRITIGARTIDIGSAGTTPVGAVISVGDLVTVWSDVPATGTVTTARSVRVKWPAGGNGNRTLSGAITDYVDMAHFKVQGVSIDAGAAALTPAGMSLAASRYVVVSGRYDGAAGKLVASTVTAYAPPAAGAVELHGSVSSFVSASSFAVRGVVVDASGARFIGGSAADVKNGAFVVILGAVSNDVVRASSIEIVTTSPMGSPMGATLDLTGTITAFDAVTGRYTLAISSGGTMNATLGAGTYYAGGSASALAVGQTVTVRGVFDGSSLATTVMGMGMSMPGSGSMMGGAR